MTNLISFKVALYVADPSGENSLGNSSSCGQHQLPSAFCAVPVPENSLESIDLYFLTKDDTKI